MEDKKIEIQLHTPILVSSTEENKKSPKSEAVVTIKGQVDKVLGAGILITVVQFKNERGQVIDSAHRKMFVPFHKVDHCFIIE